VLREAAMRHPCPVRERRGRGGRRRASTNATIIAFALVAALLGSAAVPISGAGAQTPRCDRWASPRGADSNPGTRARPFRTVGRLARKLRPGQRGCLEPGAFFNERIVLAVAGGGPHEPVTIASGPGRRAILAQGIELRSSARYVELQDLVLRARPGTPSANATVVLRGYAVHLEDSDISAGPGVDVPRTCVLLDHAGAAVIEGNTVHHCGTGANYASGIAASISVNARIADNTVYANPGDGVTLAPDAQRSRVTSNLFVENEAGVYFGGAATFASRDNRVTRNVVTDSRRYAVHGSYKQGAPHGSGNLVLDNCFWRTARVGGNGFIAAGNRVVDPDVVSAGGSYRLAPSSPCRRYGAGA
jgi:Right handed beta helix region